MVKMKTPTSRGLGKLESLNFSTLSIKDIEDISVMRVFNPIAFDSLGNSLPGGLYDPKLGPTTRSEGDCVTCGLNSTQCSGHVGNIELALPVLNPLFFDVVFKLLKKICFKCKRFRLSKVSTSVFFTRLSLLRKDKIEDLLMFDMLIKSSDNKSKGQKHKIVKKYLKIAQEADNKYYIHNQTLWYQVQKNFLESIPNKPCENCKAPHHKIRRDGYTKIFMSVLRQEKNEKRPEDEYLNYFELQKIFRKLWVKEKDICSELWGFDSDQFFISLIVVPPSKFRPSRQLGDMVVEHSQNMTFKKILELSGELRIQISNAIDIEKLIPTWIELQEAVLKHIDTSKVKNSDMQQGIKQLMEKKQGLFRMNLMGKRVNYAARSVITPDPYIGTDEIGFPVKLAKQLTFCDIVCHFNYEYLAVCVENGANKHPGALFVEVLDGKKIDLSKIDEEARVNLANEIREFREDYGFNRKALSLNFKKDFEDVDALYKVIKKENKKGKQYKVWRFIKNGDFVLANRQPTLHKPSIMAHKVRVIENDDLQTIRLHYTNCEAYNADFDGDEINVHFPQSLLAQAEARELVSTDKNYTSNTDGTPLRGLIQDHVDMGLILTKQDTFLSKSDVSQMIYVGCCDFEQIFFPKPCILKPQKLWTGKQVIDSIISSLVGSVDSNDLITFGPSKTKTPNKIWCKTYLDEFMSQSKVIFRDGVMCTGVLDKSQFGASTFGLVHCIAEIYGNAKAEQLLSALGRLFTYCSQFFSHSCCIEDLLLTEEIELKRLESLYKAEEDGKEVGKVTKDEVSLENKMQQLTSNTTSDIISKCLPHGQRVPFPRNCFSRMVNSGAKGSLVNHSQISALLGQQTLEGKRVPKMKASNKTLPCFLKNDATPRAGGFIANRFLTGLKPQEYFFHCMAGREGLVDTAVKTSRSGYLQRSLIKSLETLNVNYDETVRAEDGSVVQFTYGDDGLDTLKSYFLNGSEQTMSFLLNNVAPLCTTLNIGEGPGKINLDMESESYIDDKNGLFFNTDSIETKQIEIKNMKSIVSAFVVYKKLFYNKNAKDLSKSKLLKFIENAGLKKGATVRVVHEKEWKLAKVLRIRKLEVKVLENLTKEELVKRLETLSSPSIDVLLTISQKKVKNLKIFERIEANKKIQIAFLVKPTLPDPIGSFTQAQKANCLGISSEKLFTNANNIDLDEAKLDILKQLVALKAQKSSVVVGENVGTIAGQSIGEPSTQMTLNTFHLAGTGGGNVTLGIPRMRELLMTATKSIQTPKMTLPLLNGVTSKSKRVGKLKALLKKIELSDIVEDISVNEHIKQGCREYTIKLFLFKDSLLTKEFNLTAEGIAQKVGNFFSKRLLTIISQEISRRGDKVSTNKVSTVNEEEFTLELDKGLELDSDEERDEENEDVDVDGSTETDESDEESDKEAESVVESEDEDDLEKTRQMKNRKRKRDEVYLQVENVIQKHFAFSKLSFVSEDKTKQKSIELVLRLSSNTRRLLMLGLCEVALSQTVIKQTKNIQNCYNLNETTVGVDGCNFKAIWRLSEKVVDLNSIATNDVYSVLQTYGVEAARSCIIKEIQSVFGVYGIDVDYRHLTLVADSMTFRGSYDGCNRGSMRSKTTSEMLKMSFEQTGVYIKEASLNQATDNLTSASAQIATGGLLKHGTGCFSLLSVSRNKTVSA